MKNGSHAGFFFACLIYAAILVASAIVTYPGILHPEAEVRIPSYLDSRPFLTKVFDVNINDSTWYQAREVSYIFEIADSYFIQACSRIGFPHLLSISNYLSVFSLTVLTFYISIKYFKQRSLIIPLLLGVIYITSPASFLGVFFFRNSKEILSLALVLLTLFTIRFLERGGENKRDLVVIGILAFLASLLDRQGFYIISFLACIWFLFYAFFKKKRYYELFLLFLTVSLLNCFYNVILGPFLIRHFEGYTPDFSYQLGLNNPSTLTAPVNFLSVFTVSRLTMGLQYFLDTFSFLLGNMPLFLLIPFLGAFGFFLYISLASAVHEWTKRTGIFAGGIIILSVAAIIFLNSIMLLRHTGMMLPDVERIYYMLPAYTVFVLAANYVFASKWVYVNHHALYVIIILSLISILNVLALPGHNTIIRNGIFIKKYVDVTPLTIDCIAQKNRPPEDFKLPWTRNTLFCEALRK